MTRIYSYYADVPDLNRFDEIKLSCLWRERWAAAGWDAVILNEYQARKHPFFDELDAVVSKFPTCNPTSYERACYLRWLALAQVGGGWMSDLDVFLAGKFQKPDNLDPLSMPIVGTIYEILAEPCVLDKIIIYQTPCCPCLVWCSPENALRLCKEFVKGIGNRPQDGRGHFSDQYALCDLVEKDKVDWIQTRDVVKLYSDKGWETAPLVHFASAVMNPAKMTPKWRHIPALLK